MSAPYSNIFAVQPTDGQQVWVRRLFEEDPFLMHWSSINKYFSDAGGDFTAAGFGDPGANGQYYANAGANQTVGYINRVSKWSLYYNPGSPAWSLSPDPPNSGGDDEYETNSGGSPTDIWVVNDGTPPAGTVTSNLVIPWWMVSRWRAL